MLSAGKVDSARFSQAFETILRCAKSQGHLIEDLLDVSRIITGKLRLEARPVDMSSIVTAAVGSVRLAAQARRIRLEVVLDHHACQVSGDPHRLQQVVWNLLSNAIKFTPFDGRVQVALSRTESIVAVKVSDTGRGITPEFLPYVFDRFRQADAGTARQHSGLGLGLAIVRHLVEMHGGTVQAESDGENRGSTFTVRLPVFTAAERTLPAKDPAVHGSAHVEQGKVPAAPQRLDGLRVLVVDDEADTRDVVTLILQQSGAETMSAASASEAVETWRNWKPDVLVADIGMPEEDGYALIRRVRSRPADDGGQVPAVALTAYARPEDRLRILSAGFQLHVSKPVEPSELIRAVASLGIRRKNS
jgi:CheY-like chemotaxis protein